MIRIDFPDPTDSRWIEWQKRASKAAAELQQYANRMAAVEYQDYEPPPINEPLYKFPREWLMKAFNNKCAFCESRIDATQPGDVEHFRPKKAVHNDDGTDACFKTKAGEKRKHPGYFWLAYEWSNLLIACNTCNRSAKRNFFPVENSERRAVAPSGIAGEVPQFINPLLEDPGAHLGFEDTGMAIPLTPRGEKCVEFLKLNRDALVDERRETYDTVKLKFERCMNLKDTDEDFGKLKLELEEYYRGKRRYAAQARVALAKAKAQFEAKLKQFF